MTHQRTARIRVSFIAERVMWPHKDAMHRQSLDEWSLPVAHQHPTTQRDALSACVATVSLNDDLVDALIGSIRGHIISFKVFHHLCGAPIYRLIRDDDRINFASILLLLLRHDTHSFRFSLSSLDDYTNCFQF